MKAEYWPCLHGYVYNKNEHAFVWVELVLYTEIHRSFLLSVEVRKIIKTMT